MLLMVGFVCEMGRMGRMGGNIVISQGIRDGDATFIMTMKTNVQQKKGQTTS